MDFLYAVVESGVVTNLIWLHPNNATEFEQAVPVWDLPVQIEDTFSDGRFYHNGVLVRSQAEVDSEAISQLDAAVVQLAYENAMLLFGITPPVPD